MNKYMISLKLYNHFSAGINGTAYNLIWDRVRERLDNRIYREIHSKVYRALWSNLESPIIHILKNG